MYFTNQLFNWFFRTAQQDLVHQVNYLKKESQIYRKLVRKKRIVLEQEDIQSLVRYGLPLGCQLKNIITIVSYSCWVRWKHRKYPQDKPKKRGRPPKLTALVKEIIIRMVRMNTLWGYPRIMGELKKLNIILCVNSIKKVLKENGVSPLPQRSEGTWDEKLKRTFHTLWACDFFTKTIWTPFGIRFYYVLFFINIKTRRVHIAGITRKPDEKWVLGNITKLKVHFETSCVEGKPAVLIHDRDQKFSKRFDRFFEDLNIKVIKTPPKSPNMNPYAESWVATVKRECLNHFFILGEIHLEYLITEFTKYYNQYRPHSSMADRPLSDLEIKEFGEIYVKPVLGGLHHHYYRV